MGRTVAETEEYKGYTINVYYDDNPMNPITEWDILGTFKCFHTRYNLSNTDEFDTVDELNKHLKDCISLPLYLYDHSGITISTGPNCI